MIVVTLLEPGLAGLRAAIAEHEAVAGAFEIRLDALAEPVDPAAVRALTRRPLIATCRRTQDGGTWRGSEAERQANLTACLDAGFEWIDVEGDLPMKAPEDRLLRSRHDWDATPPSRDVVADLVRLGQRGALVKFAARVRGFNDTLELLRLGRALTRRGLHHAVMGMGDFPRPLMRPLGSRLVYGGGRRTAPYQPRAKDVAATLAHWGQPEAAGTLYLVVGAPVAHSLSPRMHNAAFRTLRRDAAYGALEVPGARELRRLLATAQDLDLAGLSVTAPLKEAAYRLVQHATPEAERAQSVNTIRIDPDAAHGHNTDGLGAAAVLADRLQQAHRDGPVLLLGAGGAARGLLAHLEGADVEVAARRDAARRSLAKAFGCRTVDPSAASRRLARYRLLINATAAEEPVPLGAYTGALFDLHYAAAPTAWQRHAAEHGNAFAGGRDLLLAQGLLAFEFWTGHKPPVDAMRHAIQEDAS